MSNYPEIGTPERRKLDLRMMQDPTHWPYRTLPLKRIRAGQGHGEFGHLALAGGGSGGAVPPIVHLADGERRYPSHEAILDDGWTVD